MASINNKSIKAYKKKFGVTPPNPETSYRQYAYSGDFQQAPHILMSAYNAWNSLSDLRLKMRRNERFMYGDQHGDLIYDYETRRMTTERALFIKQGVNPSQHNVIQNISRSMTGVWLSNKTIPYVEAQENANQGETEMLTATLQAHYRKHEIGILETQVVDITPEFGVAVIKTDYQSRKSEIDVQNDWVSPFDFFVDNSMKDPRQTDCSLIGNFYDRTIDDIVGLYAGGNKERELQIRSLYAGADRERVIQFAQTYTDERIEENFFTPPVQNWGMCRVIEVWRKESKQVLWVRNYLDGTRMPYEDATEKDLRAMKDAMYAEQLANGVAPEDMRLIDWTWDRYEYWKFYHLTPFGNVLASGKNPFWHEEYPYVYILYKFIDGKIFPFFTDVIDTQKQINNMIVVSQLLMRHSAKNIVFADKRLFEDEPGGPEAVETKLTKFNSVITYDGKNNVTPPIYQNTVAQSFTPLNLVNTYIGLIEKSSGIFGALQGQTPTAGTPAQSYEQQTQNSAVSLNGFFEAINSFRLRLATKNLKLIQQFKKEEEYIFHKESGSTLKYNPQLVRHFDAKIAITEGTDTPAFRNMINQTLMNLKQYDAQNQLDLEAILTLGNFPFKDKALDYIHKHQQAMQQGQPAPEMPQDVKQGLEGYQFTPDLQAKFAQLPADVQQYVAQQAQQN